MNILEDFLAAKDSIFRNFFRKLYWNSIFAFGCIFKKEDRNWLDFKHYFSTLIDDTFIHPFRYTWYGLQNFWTWKSIIFHNRDWDHYYITVMLKKKLEMTAASIEKYHNHVNADKDIKTLKFCAKRLSEIETGDFCKTLHEKHEIKFGKTKMFSFPHSTDDSGKILTYKCEFLKTKVNPRNEELVEEEKQAYRKIIEIEHRREKRCFRLLFSCMEKYYLSWWD